MENGINLNRLFASIYCQKKETFSFFFFYFRGYTYHGSNSSCVFLIKNSPSSSTLLIKSSISIKFGSVLVPLVLSLVETLFQGLSKFFMNVAILASLYLSIYFLFFWLDPSLLTSILGTNLCLTKILIIPLVQIRMKNY